MITFIIPSHNDTKCLPKTVKAIHDTDFETEIIVVDDGSTQSHKDKLAKLKDIKLITHKTNLGKAAGMKTGIESSTGNIIAFIDADIVGLTTKNITDLVTPVVNEEFDITLSKKGSGFSKMGGYGFTQTFTGERVMKKDLLIKNIDMFDSIKGYQIESEMNKRFFGKYKIAVVKWKNVSNPSKIRHGVSGVKSDMKMYNTIREYLGIEELTKQVNTARKFPTIN